MHALFDLPIHRANRWIFNCYGVVDGERITLVDVGLPSVAHDMLAGLSAIGYEPSAVHNVLCTHGHPDHVAGIPRILEKTEAEVHLPAKCASYMAGEVPRVFGLNEMLRFLPVWGTEKFDLTAAREMAKASGSIGFGGVGQTDFRLPFTPTGFVETSANPPGLEGWTSLETPGHTEDSTCFYHEDSGTLLSGDAVVTVDGRAWFNPEWIDADLSVATEEQLRALDVRYLLPGHGQPIEGPDIWARARSFDERPEARGFLGRCARTLARWP